MADRRRNPARSRSNAGSEPVGVDIVPTGVQGLDTILGGGLPRGRSVLVVGGAGSGKTLLATEFLIRGIQQYREPGVLVSFEERVDELASNAAGFGWDLKRHMDDKNLYATFVNLAPAETIEMGDFDLSGLFLRIEMAIKAVGAKRIVLDGMNNLLATFSNERIVRAELLRLFAWLKEQGLTVIATGERGVSGWTRLGFEEYLADGLIVLDNRIEDKVARRTLRVVKCRGADHATDEFPFLIGEEGFSLFPILAAELDYKTSTRRVRTGIDGLDEMLGGKGFYRGSTVLVSGSAGTGKSSLAASFVNAACARGERALMVSFEEAPAQIVRNMRSIGIDLGAWEKEGLLTIYATRAMHQGTEGHLTDLQEIVRQADPKVVAIDPISALMSVGTENEIRSMAVRLIDYLRGRGITTMATNLAVRGRTGEMAELAVSSMADTWILVRTLEHHAERNNVIQVLKSRGMAHSNQMREFNFTQNGIEIVDAYIGVNGVVIGSARRSQEAADRIEALRREAELEKKRRSLVERRREIDAQIQALEAGYASALEEVAAEATALEKITAEEQATSEDIARERGLQAAE